MKRIALLLLLCMQSMQGMYTLQSCLHAPRRYAFNAYENFGRKHFIVGCDTYPKNTKQATKKIVDENKKRSTACYFTSFHDVRKEITQCLQGAKKNICIATFALTDTKIADELIRAQQKNITVIIVTDKERMKDKYSKIKKLVTHNIPVRYYNAELNPKAKSKRAKDGLMHHKFMIIDGEVLVFGSLNLTKAGQEENIENITVTKKQYMIADYNEEFKRLLKLSSPVTTTLLE